MQWNGTFYFEFIGESIETATTWLKFPNGGKPILEEILVSEEINPKEQDCESQSQGSE